MLVNHFLVFILGAQWRQPEKLTRNKPLKKRNFPEPRFKLELLIQENCGRFLLFFLVHSYVSHRELLFRQSFAQPNHYGDSLFSKIVFCFRAQFCVWANRVGWLWRLTEKRVHLQSGFALFIFVTANKSDWYSILCVSPWIFSAQTFFVESTI